MSHTIFQYIEIAKQRMKQSADPVHDSHHAARVAEYAAKLGKKTKLSPNYTEALILAAWWHDVSRTLNKKPSFIWMPFVDDMISGIMLWWTTRRLGLAEPISQLAVRTICCKSLGTGALLTKLLMKKSDRIMVHLLKDADALDVLDIERMHRVLVLTEDSRLYHFGYKIMVQWYTLTSQLYMKTQAAREFMVQQIKRFLAWLRQPHILAWHIRQFGRRWMRRNLARFETTLRRINHLAERSERLSA